jgi:hypothetical protein
MKHEKKKRRIRFYRQPGISSLVMMKMPQTCPETKDP